MISTLKQVAIADKLSTQQLQKAVQDGTIESWIGIPLIQQRMKEQKQAQASATMNQPKQPPIAEQVMQEASAQNGVSGLPSNLPEQYAGGGIIGYAEGGEADEDYQDYLDNLEEEQFQEYADAMTNRTNGARGMTYGQVSGSRLKADRAAPETKSDHKYADLVSKYAEKYGVDKNLALHVLNKETGGMQNPETARSKAGAMGIMQLMPGTAKMLGVKDPYDPEQSAEGGVRYLSMLKKDVGGDPRLIAAAYNAGPGNVRKAGGVPKFAETQRYVEGLAEGGIAHYDDGGDVGDYQDDMPWDERIAKWKEMTGFGSQLPKTQPKQIGLPAAIQAGTNPRAFDNQTMAAAASIEKQNKDNAQKSPAAGGGSEDKGSTPASNTDYYQSIMDKIAQREADRASNKDQDKWMGLLSAGLGMMGGTSPYAGVNIGQGAMYGLNQYGQARKQSAAEEAADLKTALMAGRYADIGQSYRDKYAQTAEQKDADRKLKEQEYFGNLMNKMKAQRVSEAQARYGKDVNLMTPEVRAQYDAFINDLGKDKRYIAAETRYYDMPEGVIVKQTSAR